jgi:hypothetical protein
MDKLLARLPIPDDYELQTQGQMHRGCICLETWRTRWGILPAHRSARAERVLSLCAVNVGLDRGGRSPRKKRRRRVRDARRLLGERSTEWGKPPPWSQVPVIMYLVRLTIDCAGGNRPMIAIRTIP